MNQQWYYGTKDNQQRGPVDAAVILEKLRNNELTRDSLVWREGMAQWQRIWTLMAELETPSSSAINNTPVIPQTNHYTASAANASIASSKTSSGNNHKAESAASPYVAPTSDLATKAVVHGGEVIYAGFWRRFAAFLVDNLLVGIITQVLAGIIGVVSGILGTNQDEFSAGMIFTILLTLLITVGFSVTYYAWLHSSNSSATLGKMLVGIKVVSPDGERISFLRGVGRFFATYISSIILWIGYIMAAFTDRKQALHDMMCDTLVVDKWAFTDRPQLQQQGVGTATVVILSIFSLLFFITFVFVIIVISVGITNN